MGLIERIRQWWLEGYSDYYSERILLESGFNRQSKIVGRLNNNIEGNPMEKAIEILDDIEELTLEAKPSEIEKVGLETPSVCVTPAPTLDDLTHTKLDKPARDELDKLKSILGLTEGSVAYKHGAIYNVGYDRLTKKHKWQRLGSWQELRQRLLESQNPQ